MINYYCVFTIYLYGSVYFMYNLLLLFKRCIRRTHIIWISKVSSMYMIGNRMRRIWGRSCGDLPISNKETTIIGVSINLEISKTTFPTTTTSSNTLLQIDTSLHFTNPNNIPIMHKYTHLTHPRFSLKQSLIDAPIAIKWHNQLSKINIAGWRG